MPTTSVRARNILAVCKLKMLKGHKIGTPRSPLVRRLWPLAVESLSAIGTCSKIRVLVYTDIGVIEHVPMEVGT